jgi:hypothetical protein
MNPLPAAGNGCGECSNSLRYAAFALFFASKPGPDFGQNAFIH